MHLACHNSLLYRLFRFRNTPDYTTVLSANIKDTAQRARPCFELPVPACHLKCNIIIIILFIWCKMLIYCNVVVVVSVLITMYLRRLTGTYPYHRGPTLFIYSKYVVLCLLYDIPPWMTHYGVRVSQHVLNCHFYKLLSEEEAIPKGVLLQKKRWCRSLYLSGTSGGCPMGILQHNR